MRVFVTGASGWIGSAVVPELIGAGHQVLGLARSDESAATLAEAGAEVCRGTLDDLGVLRGAAAGSDGVIHLAYKHDLMIGGDAGAAVEADRRAIDAFGEALAGSGRPLVIANGTLGVTPGRILTEQDGQASAEGSAAEGSAQSGGPATRMANAHAAVALAEGGVRSSVVRLAPTVHGDGDYGFLPVLIGVARERGVAGYIGDGAARWSAVHRFDAARLFRLAAESAPAGSTLHAAGDEGVPMRDIAEAIGRGLGLPTASISPADAPAHFGWLAPTLDLDSPASSARTRELLDWRPTGPGLLDDLDKGHYFADRPA
ncbi:SDR family oxidoreductase [Streptomyces sp. NPDC050610]|uniref:SDR family oxidoreductase n=1 Tax=Streptomyces sp. NPDC050610 TaxID=3157097 RepID=UPI00344335CA